MFDHWPCMWLSSHCFVFCNDVYYFNAVPSLCAQVYVSVQSSYWLEKSERIQESQGIKKVRETSEYFVGGHGKLTCIIWMCDCCCNIVSGQKCDELFWIIGIRILNYLFFYLSYCIWNTCRNQNGNQVCVEEEELTKITWKHRIWKDLRNSKHDDIEKLGNFILSGNWEPYIKRSVTV